MIQTHTILTAADNVGAKRFKCIKVLGGNQRRYARIGDIITTTVVEAIPHSSVKKGDIVHAVVVRQRKEFRRHDGSYIRFDENAVVLVEKGKKEPRGGRIFGPIPREIGEKGYQKIISMAPEVV